MRSVVVVLPASMCAMIPMLRVLASWAWVSAMSSISSCRPCGACPCAGSGLHPGDPRAGDRRSPAVVREGLVRLGHLVGVLAALDRGTEAVGGVEDLVHEALGHGLLTPLARVADQPAQRQRRRAVRLDLDRNLVGRTADAAGLD